ncbi:MAG: stalk domain-containing protein [Clostridia bacterium]|nr:stalk domain-containing protein [Clostridia bacterium]
MTLNAAGELEIKQKDPENYLITILRSENGTALADKTETGKDDEVTLNAIPKSGYMLEEFIVTDADSNPITVEDGKFVMPEKNVFITATFKEAPKSSGTKKYKADDKETAEKISGSGKKGSTRTITPIEGKKVASVVVTDKDGNKIDVTVNEDGTYSFKQPASDVNIEVTYKNREITLNIGSTEASVDGERENLDVSPVIRNDRTMLPIRFVAENLGAKVGWDEKNPNIVTISRGDTEIVIHLGSEKMLVNGKEVILDSVAFAENDRTYLPVRAISEALNAIVEWNEERPMEVKIYER